MEQAGKRQQARNPGNTERAQEQTWRQASKVIERKGFIKDQIKKNPNQTNQNCVGFISTFSAAELKGIRGQVFSTTFYSSKGVDAFKRFLKFFFK